MSRSKGMRCLVTGLGIFSIGLGTAQLVAPRSMNRLIGAVDTPSSGTVHRWAGGAREFAVGVGILSRSAPAVWLWSRVAGDGADLGVLGALLASNSSPEARKRAALSTVAVVGVTVADVVAAVRESGSAA